MKFTEEASLEKRKITFHRGKHEKFDRSAFSAEKVAEQYSKIYSSRDKG